jgi:hypothetical protein
MIDMENPNEKKAKVYQKPSWEKQQLFERFVMACTTKNACRVNRSGYRT